MSTAPLYLALQDQDLMERISALAAAVGREVSTVITGRELMGAIQGPSDLIVDPRLAPEGIQPGAFIASVTARARGGRALVLSFDGMSDDALLELGASDVFRAEDSAKVILRRLTSAPLIEDVRGEESAAVKPVSTAVNATAIPAAAPAECPSSDLGLVQDQPAAATALDERNAQDAIEGFTERVAVRLTRARDRERTVAIFCASVRGLSAANPRREIQGVLETVLEELDTTQQMSYSASRVAIAQMGEDIYGILVPDIERVQDAARLAVRFHEAMAMNQGVTAHIGISCSPDDGTVATELIGRAKDAVVRARQAGENHVEFASDSMSRWAFERLTLEQSLRDALRNRELVVYYQPRIDIETRKILGMEALVRWIHPQFGLVSPGQFIPLAEETGLIVPIGDWILRDACRQNAAWRAMGLPNIRVSVNLSPVQFRKPNLHEDVYAALDDAGLEADGLELEVTESLLMNDPSETAATLGKLKARGIHISIDDFGTGYSSLSYLKRFPINALKIDRSFITDVTSNPDDAAIATAIILMGHSLKLSVVAEGVETENQLAFLKVLQCNEVQGYLFSPPVPAERAQEMLEKQMFVPQERAA